MKSTPPNHTIMENTNELQAAIERVIQQLNDFYNGDNWVTDNLEKKIFSLESSVALKKVQGHSHSIAELLSHITAWRNFAVQKLNGNNGFDIEDNSAGDWPEAVDWDTIRREFEECHQRLLTAIKNFPVEQWHTKVAGRNYSFVYLINGIVEHDYYHYGQIGSVLAAIKKAE